MAPFHEVSASQVESLKRNLSEEHELALDTLHAQNALLRQKLDSKQKTYRELSRKYKELQPEDYVMEEREELCETMGLSDPPPSEVVREKDIARQAHPSHQSGDELIYQPGHRWACLVEQALVHEVQSEEARMLDELYSMRMHSAWRTTFRTVQKRRASQLDCPIPLQEIPRRMSTKHQLGTAILDDYRQRWQRMISSPTSNLRLGWSIAGMFFIFIDISVIPLSIFDLGDHIFFKVQQVVSWLFWLFDVFVSFISGYDKNGRIEMRPAVIAKMYLRTMFPFDIFILSIDVMMFTLDASSGSEADASRTTRIIRSLRLLRLLRLLRVGKLRAILKACEKRSRNPYSVLVLKSSSALATVSLINHFIACGWYYVGLEGNPSRNWIILSQSDGQPFGEVYVSAMHWSLTQFMPATNNIGPDNVFERLFAIMTVSVAVCSFSSSVGSITAAVGSFRQVQAEKSKQEASVHAFFEERKLSAELFDEMREHGQESQKGRDIAVDVTTKMSDIKLFRDCPESLKLRLNEEVFMPAFQHPAWIQKDSMDPSFSLKVCHTMFEKLESPGKDLFLPDQTATLAFYVASGSSNFAESQGTIQKKVGPPSKVLPGSWLCEPVLWAQWYHRGQLTSTSTSFSMCLDSAKFIDLALETGGPTYQFLFMFGILYVGMMERLCSEGSVVTDRGIEAQHMQDLADRASKFLAVSASSSAFMGKGKEGCGNFRLELEEMPSSSTT